MALPYGSTSGLLDVGSNVPSALQQTIWANYIVHAAEEKNPLLMLEGPEGSGAPIWRVDQLKTKGGATYTMGHMTPFETDPQKMDFDTHTYEDAFTFDDQSISIIAWKRSWISSALQKQYPNFSLRDATLRGLQDYHLLMNAKFGLSALREKTWTGDDSSGTLYTGATCYNQIIAGQKPDVSKLNDDDIMTSEIGAIALDMMYSGYRRAGSTNWVFEQPTVQGEVHDAVCLMHRHQAYQLCEQDAKFQQALNYAEQRGDQNRRWRGVGTAFKYNGIFYLVLSGKIGNFLLFSAGDTIKDDTGTSKTASVDGAVAIFMGAGAACRVTGEDGWAFKGEGWDTEWFQRISTAKIEGWGARMFEQTPGTATTMRDKGRLLVFTAAPHPNRRMNP